ncbi:43600_t:CDS:2 [Gigaspora margarita]|uniref:43600_t:CDS:1 n=1 Tax=Gigaspora margarita TaxID=4874 RepID=A0ABN7UGI0_GIGMA|nr:43600_t:CDS:2 [Gigaspora margarita]
MYYRWIRTMMNILIDPLNDLSWFVKLNMTRSTTHGLKKIHKEGIIHRDFHRGNILVKINHEIAICDFGISKPACKSQYMYIAPEAFNEGNLTTASDI